MAIKINWQSTWNKITVTAPPMYNRQIFTRQQHQHQRRQWWKQRNAEDGGCSLHQHRRLACCSVQFLAVSAILPFVRTSNLHVRTAAAVVVCGHFLHMSHVAWSAYVCELCKTTEPINTPFRGRFLWAKNLHVVQIV